MCKSPPLDPSAMLMFKVYRRFRLQECVLRLPCNLFPWRIDCVRYKTHSVFGTMLQVHGKKYRISFTLSGGPALGDLYGTYPIPVLARFRTLMSPWRSLWQADREMGCIGITAGRDWMILYSCHTMLLQETQQNYSALPTINTTTGSCGCIWKERIKLPTGFVPTNTMGVWVKAPMVLVCWVSVTLHCVYGSSTASFRCMVLPVPQVQPVCMEKEALTDPLLHGELPGTGYAIYGASQLGKAGFFKNFNLEHRHCTYSSAWWYRQGINLTQNNILNNAESFVINNAVNW